MTDSFNEYDPLKVVAIRRVQDAFVSQAKIDTEWEALRFHEAPDMIPACREYEAFEGLLRDTGAKLIPLTGDMDLTLDAIYVRDSMIPTPKGIVLCNMGRMSRKYEPYFNAEILEVMGYKILGQIEEPGTLEGGDFIWINEKAAAVGLGPRTNWDGVRQLKKLLGSDVDLHVVQLPEPDHPDDVFHLMSMISPLDHDLALIYRPLMPDHFIEWLSIDHGMRFVDVPDEEFAPMACNVLATAPSEVLMLENLPVTTGRLEEADVLVRPYKGIEISRKGEGGPTCLTRPLVRSKSID